MMSDDAAGVDEIDALVCDADALRRMQSLRNALTTKIDVRRRAAAVQISAPPRNFNESRGNLIAGHVRAGGTVKRQHARGAAGAAAKIQHAERAVGNMAA